ncbi:MAG: BREX-6 system BrxE protein [Polyangiaceae bacterium]|jgi:hypothetical protein
MPSRLAPNQLDELLALQLTAAWAGEAAGEPARLGWWKTDLVDAQGGGDLFARLVPRTAAWASLSLVRAAARRIDTIARQSLARGDDVWTPFHLGFLVDEQIDDRIAYHRAHGHVPAEVLGPRYLVGTAWSKPAFEALLSGLAAPRVTVSPAGRRVMAPAASPSDAAPLLFAALLPLVSSYPLPYLEGAT